MVFYGQNFTVLHTGVQVWHTKGNDLSKARGVEKFQETKGKDGQGVEHVYTGYRFRIKSFQPIRNPTTPGWIVRTDQNEEIWLLVSNMYHNKRHQDFPEHKDEAEIEAALKALASKTMTEEMNPKPRTTWDPRWKPEAFKATIKPSYGKKPRVNRKHDKAAAPGDATNPPDDAGHADDTA